VLSAALIADAHQPLFGFGGALSASEHGVQRVAGARLDRGGYIELVKALTYSVR
jgi:hypothetical protein